MAGFTAKKLRYRKKQLVLSETEVALHQQHRWAVALQVCARLCEVLDTHVCPVCCPSSGSRSGPFVPAATSEVLDFESVRQQLFQAKLQSEEKAVTNRRYFDLWEQTYTEATAFMAAAEEEKKAAAVADEKAPAVEEKNEVAVQDDANSCELLESGTVAWVVERVLKRKRNGECFVKWAGWPEQWNSWTVLLEEPDDEHDPL